jgi:ribonucleases P/MRP protein subunit RPP40
VEILRGSVLGPLLFLIYINDIDDSACNNLLEFADDTKVFSEVRNDKDISKLQNDLVNLGK